MRLFPACLTRCTGLSMAHLAANGMVHLPRSLVWVDPPCLHNVVHRRAMALPLKPARYTPNSPYMPRGLLRPGQAFFFVRMILQSSCHAMGTSVRPIYPACAGFRRLPACEHGVGLRASPVGRAVA